MTMFATIKGKKQCFPIGFLFQEGVEIIAYLIVPKSQLS
jgi:hypothetical protein